MPRLRRLLPYIKFIGLATVLVATPLPVSAQQPQAVTATGTWGEVIALTMTFPPAGGAVIGHAFNQSTWKCGDATSELTMTGTFSGGDGGKAFGTFEVKVDSPDEDCMADQTVRGSWNGNLFANGTGSGTMTADAASDFPEWSGTAWPPWKVTFSPQAFQTGFAPAVTSEYIYNTYGIKVEASFGDDKWAPKAWSAEELVLLNDVLKELPPSLLKKMSLTSIIRNQTDLDEGGNPDPETSGLYSPCERTVPKHGCHPSSDAVIRVFDSAFDPREYSNDPAGYKAFKSTILHELTHALQRPPQEDTGMAAADPLSRNRSGYVSPLMQNYNDATRIITDINDPAFQYDNGWGTRLDGSWVLASAPGNMAPTAYAKTNPKEDMAESVKLYVYDPQRLLNSSPRRYNFIRDQIFGGVEYEDGHQK